LITENQYFQQPILFHLKILEPIHNTEILLSIGAFCSSPIENILNIAGIPSIAVLWEEKKSN